MTDADKKLYNKAEELFCQNCKLRTEQCLFAYRKVNGIEDCRKSCGCEEVPAWIDGYQEGLKAKINATTISDCPIKVEWHKVADGDLPKNSDDEKLYLVYWGENYHGVAQFNNSRWWSFDSGWFDVKDVIAWCEIPLYEEE